MKNVSRMIMIRMFIGLAVFIILLLINAGFIAKVYFTDQATYLGIALNMSILILFLTGIYKIFAALKRYAYEEEQIKLFIMEKSAQTPFSQTRLSPGSIIYHRYEKVRELYDRSVPVNHGALTSVMMAQESLFLSFPKFINNVLILTGVFGTIVSLILALTGAGAVLKAQASSEGMWMILHGMNTALTTTATAITCFFFFTYFYHRLTDIQTHIFGKIEDTVLMYIVPEFTYQVEDMNYQADKLIRSLSALVGDIKNVSTDISSNLAQTTDMGSSQLQMFKSILTAQRQSVESSIALTKELAQIKEILKDGFRLR